jgi:hypothetical protein
VDEVGAPYPDAQIVHECDQTGLEHDSKVGYAYRRMIMDKKYEIIVF